MVLEARSEGQPPNATQKPQELSLQLAKAQPPKWERRKRSYRWVHARFRSIDAWVQAPLASPVTLWEGLLGRR